MTTPAAISATSWWTAAACFPARSTWCPPTAFHLTAIMMTSSMRNLIKNVWRCCPNSMTRRSNQKATGMTMKENTRSIGRPRATCCTTRPPAASSLRLQTRSRPLAAATSPERTERAWPATSLRRSAASRMTTWAWPPAEMTSPFVPKSHQSADAKTCA